MTNPNEKQVLTDDELLALFKSVPQMDVTTPGGWVRPQRIAYGRTIERAVIEKVTPWPSDKWWGTYEMRRKEFARACAFADTDTRKSVGEALDAHVRARILPAASEADPTIRNSLMVASESGAIACLRRNNVGGELGQWTLATVEDGKRVTGLRTWEVRWLVDAVPPIPLSPVAQPSVCDSVQVAQPSAPAAENREPSDGGHHLALELAIDAIENAPPQGDDWPVNWPAILMGLKGLRNSLASTMPTAATADAPAQQDTLPLPCAMADDDLTDDEFRRVTRSVIDHHANQPAPTAQGDERATFESSYSKKYGVDLTAAASGDYKNPMQQTAWEMWETRATLSRQPSAPASAEATSLRGAASLAFNALHECNPIKGAEKQVSDAIQALTEALHDIAYTVNRTATPRQFADYLQREARAALAAAKPEGGAE